MHQACSLIQITLRLPFTKFDSEDDFPCGKKYTTPLSYEGKETKTFSNLVQVKQMSDTSQYSYAKLRNIFSFIKIDPYQHALKIFF